MGRIFGHRDGWNVISKRLRLLRKRSFCTSNSNNEKKGDGSVSTYDDAYHQLDKLDFMTASKILFTTPPKKKKFGIDFHLVQFFFACMPSLAVYLVAQYARYEMRKMEAELELKKQAEEEAKAKEMELNASEEKEAGPDPEILDVRMRLDKMEAAVKEIVAQSKKQSGSTSTENQNIDGAKGHHTTSPEQSDNPSRSDPIVPTAAKDHS
ncbi:uncharacterized protein LOC127790666 [Diospyros lotus]|uniref:uncharacterized protein LOC127790666 n=1 Tax=Diospyros lotus TaxID=55363 RepID=UPI00224FBE71|nr:uncharacterized protein LOC127790666 [Diospyros lotus]